MMILCIECIAKLHPDLMMKDCGGLVNGERIRCIENAFRAAANFERRN